MPDSETLRLVKTESLSDPFIAAGDRAYLVGAQHGGFPDMGWHTTGEMGGIWAHPVKLLDGFWLSVDGSWLRGAHRFISGSFFNEQEYDLEDDLVVTRRQFAPDGEPAVVVRFTFRSPAHRTLALRFLARTDLQAVWPGDAMSAGIDHAAYDPDLAAWVCGHEHQPWYVVVGSPTKRASGTSDPHLWGPEQTAGNGISVTLDFTLELAADVEDYLDLIVCGSYLDRGYACETFRRVRDAVDAMWRSKATRYGALLGRSALTVPDESIERAWDWMKCSYDWLVRDVPETGRGLGAGAEEYVWWFGCDASYALLGALALGQHELAVETVDLLRSVSWHANEGNGRIIHECTTAGYVAHHGCVQETPQFITSVWQVFLWTGDLSFLERNYESCKRGLLHWTLGEQCPDGDLLPFGCGITEREGMDLQCVDTATFTVKALMALADMAGVLGDEPVASRCATLASLAQSRLDDAFWMEDEGLYGDMVATPAEMVPRLHRWISQTEGLYYRSGQTSEVANGLTQLLRQAESDQQPHRKRPWLLKHWIVLCPLEQQLTSPHKAARSLERLEGAEFTGPWGVYLSGYDRTHAMSISTGAAAVAEMAYGRVERGLQYVRALTDTLDMHMPGGISEMSPNYGCFVQAWSGYAVAWPLVRHMFGLQPDAFAKRLTLSPTFPAGWPEAHLSNVRIGGSTFDFGWDGDRLTVTAHDPGWTITSTTVPLRIRQPSQHG